MKLDYIANPSGRGKYALINLRRAPDFDPVNPECVKLGGHTMTLIPAHALDPSGFFVVKHKDRFAVAAMRAYASELTKYADSPECPLDKKADYLEFAISIAQEAQWIEDQKINTHLPD